MLGDRDRPARKRYLEIATDLAVRHQGGRQEVPYMAARVQLADVAAAIGRSRTALYRQWETQHDFWVDLTLYLAYQDDLTRNADDVPWQAAMEALAGTRVAGEDAVELLRVLGNAGHDELDASPWFLVRAALLGYPDVPGLAEVRRQVEERRMRLLTAFAAQALVSVSRTPMPPFTSDDLATILWCAADAQRVRRYFLPGYDELWWLHLDEPGGTQEWSLWAFMARAIILERTEADGPGVEPPPRQPPPPVATIEPLHEWTPLQSQALAAATNLLLADLLAPGAAGHAGDGVADERGTRDLAVLGHVTIARVAAAAGVSRRAVYDVWPTRDDMVLDLLRTEVAARRAAIAAGFERLTTGGVGREIVPAMIDALIGGLADRSPAPDIVLAFVPAASDRRVRAIVAEGHDPYLAECARQVGRILRVSGRRLRPGVMPEHVALLWLNLVEGGRRLRRTNPAALRPGTAVRPSALGMAALAVFDHATVAS